MEHTWVIIPGYNEGARINAVLEHVKKHTKNIIVVDDGSTDDTALQARKHTKHVLTHIVNLGKGNAVKTGCDYAITLGATKLILMDSDGQHEPKDIPRFLHALEHHDIVFGYREFDQEMPSILKIGNTGINLITRLLFGMNLRDTQCGFRAIRARVYPLLRWAAEGYAMESEMIARAGKHRLRYNQIPIRTIYEDRYKGTTVIDGLKIGLRMLAWKVEL